MHMRHLPALFACALFSLTTPAFAAPAPVPAASATAAAGEVILLTGRGTATNAEGTIRPLVKGDAVHAGDILNAGANSYINIRFSDGAFVLLRPNTRFAIEQYAYTPPASAEATTTPASPPPAQPAKPAAPATVTSAPAASPQASLQRAFLHLLKGGFRTVSGLIGKTHADDYQVTTPVATIGIRGTDYYAFICDLACASDPVIAQSLDLLHADRSLAEGATLTAVLHGSIAVTNASDHTETLTVDQYLLTLTDGRQIRLPAEPRFMRVSPFPNPLTMCPN